jgi:rod shape-determining protein MreC
MTYQSNKGIIAPFGFIGTYINYLNEMIHSLSTSMKEPFRKIMVRDEENGRLREEVNRLMMEQQRYRDIFFENRRLREVLALKEKEQRYITTARIVSRGLDRWSNTVVLEKGKRAGITKDMAAITPSGLVGKVSMAGDAYAYVLLMNDINFSASVRIQETRREAILSGTGGGRCILKYIPHEEEIREGEVVVTSGFDDLFPQEVPVGYISRVMKKSTSIFQDIEVTPFQDLTKLDEVIIVRR